MGTNSRELSVRFVGDAGALKSTFAEVSAAAQTTGGGLGSLNTSTDQVGRTFFKTGKLFKTTGKVLRSSGLEASYAARGFLSAVPALGALSGAAGQFALVAGDLGGILSGLSGGGMVLIAGAAVAAGAAYVIFRDRVSAATAALNLQTAANLEVAKATQATIAAVNASKDENASLVDSVRGQDQAVLSLAAARQRLSDIQDEGGKGSADYAAALLAQESATQKVSTAMNEHGRSSLEYRKALFAQEQATKKVTEAEKAGGKGTLEHRQAILNLKSAQDDITKTREATRRQGAEAASQSKAVSKAIDEEAAATKSAAVEARKRQVMIRLGLIQGKDVAAAEKEVAKAIAADGKASAVAADKHRANAQRMRELAGAVGTVTPKAKLLHDRLIELSRTEVSMANAIAAMAALKSAASSAAAGVQNVYNLLKNPPSVSLPSAPAGRGGGSRPGRGAPGPAGQKADEFSRSSSAPRLPSNPSFGLRGASTGSPTDLARTTSAGDRRGRSARSRAETRARKPGVGEEDVSQAGERAFIAARKVTVNALRTKINARRKALIIKLKSFDIAARMKVKVPGPKYPEKRQAALDRRAAMKATADGIREELEGLAVDYRDLALELRDLGEQVEALDRTDEAEAAAAAEASAEAGTGPKGITDVRDPQPTAGDFLDAAAAEAALTPDLGDDLAAARAIEDRASAELSAARASGDPRRIADAARAALSARQTREQIEATMKNTAALDANTDAIKQSFGGSVTFGFRGQAEVLGSLAPPSSDRLTGGEVGL